MWLKSFHRVLQGPLTETAHSCRVMSIISVMSTVWLLREIFILTTDATKRPIILFFKSKFLSIIYIQQNWPYRRIQSCNHHIMIYNTSITHKSFFKSFWLYPSNHHSTIALSFLEFHTHRIYVVFCIWLLLFSIMPSRFIHVAGHQFFLLLNNIPLYENTTIFNSQVGIWLVCSLGLL